MSTRLLSTGWRVGVPVMIFGAGVVIGVIGDVKFRNDGPSSYFPWAALILMSAVMLTIIIVFDAIAGNTAPANRRRYGWVNAVLGSDGRVSTSKTQVFLWTIVLTATLLYLAGVVIFRSAHDDGVLTSTDWNDYVILLGGPFAAGVLAKFAVVTKLQDGSIQKTLTPAASANALGTPASAAAVAAAPAAAAAAVAAVPTTAADAVTNDAGELDLVDSQYLFFNFVALVYVVGLFVTRIVDKHVVDPAEKFSLPKIPAVLLGLTSAAAATYVANKAVQKNAPSIATLNPPNPVAGAAVDVLGVNLVPSGTDDGTAKSDTQIVVIGGGNSYLLSPALDWIPTATKVTFDMPPIGTATDVTIQVITAARVATSPFPTKTAP